jgi:hypothetical protein
VHNTYVAESFVGDTPRGELHYTRLKLDAFIFDQVAGVLVMQGMTLQDLFPPDAHFVCVWEKHPAQILVAGPFVLLKGEASAGWDPPLRLKDVVLAALESVPAGMTRDDVLAFLLKEAV